MSHVVGHPCLLSPALNGVQSLRRGPSVVATARPRQSAVVPSQFPRQGQYVHLPSSWNALCCWWGVLVSWGGPETLTSLWETNIGYISCAETNIVNICWLYAVITQLHSFHWREMIWTGEILRKLSGDKKLQENTEWQWEWQRFILKDANRLYMHLKLEYCSIFVWLLGLVGSKIN